MLFEYGSQKEGTVKFVENEVITKEWNKRSEKCKKNALFPSFFLLHPLF